MEQHGWSLEVTTNEFGKRRHVLLDEEETRKGCKRVCVEPFQGPIGLEASSDFCNPIPSWEAQIGTMYPYFQLTEMATNSLDAHLPTTFMAEPAIHNSADLLSNGGEVFGTGHRAAGVALTSITNMPLMFPDTGIGAQALGPGPSTPAVTNMSQQNADEDPWALFNQQDYQIQQLNHFEGSWGTYPYDPDTDFWVNSAASFGRQPDLSPLQYLPPIQSQSVGMTFFPTNFENSTLEAGIETGLSEWPCMNNKANPLESELTANMETQSKCQNPATSESSIMASSSGKQQGL